MPVEMILDGVYNDIQLDENFCKSLRSLKMNGRLLDLKKFS
jgi:hypothetical protein